MVFLVEATPAASYQKRGVLARFVNRNWCQAPFTIHPGTRKYLSAAYELSDDRGYVDVSAIADLLGKGLQELSSTRENALNTQVIKSASYGKLKFALPHYRYIFDPYIYAEPEVSDDEWDF